MFSQEIKDTITQLMGRMKIDSTPQSLKRNKPVYKKMLEETSFLDDQNPKIVQRMYHVMHEIHEPVICSECKIKKCKFNYFNSGYRICCSLKCSNNSDSRKQKYIDTCMKKYGTINAFQAEEVKEKSKKTLIEKYGEDNISKTKENKEKIKNIAQAKYGTDAFFSAKELQEKSRKTMMERHGVLWGTQVEGYKEKSKKTYMEKYGVDTPMKVDSVKAKMVATMQEKYGVDYVFQRDDVRKKAGDAQRAQIEKEFLVKLDRILPESLSYLGKEGDFKYKFKCSTCDNEFSIYHQFLYSRIESGVICTYCHPPTTTSSFQAEVSKYVKDLVGVDNVVDGNRTILGNGQELDIVVDNKISFELDGLYWHSDARTHKYDIRTYHLKKTELAREKGAELIHIFEDEWKHKKEIVKHRLKIILNKCDAQRIHARKCIIKEIDQIEKNKFLEEFHLQGSDISKIRLGAFYNDQLVSVMTFSKPSISKGSVYKENIWELNRFCSDYKYHIPGIASKLLAHFVRNYNWNEIITYADLRWSNGNVYKQLGFEFISQSDPCYWYVDFKTMTRKHRFNFRKSQLTHFDSYDESLTEREIMIKEGYSRIYDCGHLKFKLTNI